MLVCGYKKGEYYEKYLAGVLLSPDSEKIKEKVAKMGDVVVSTSTEEGFIDKIMKLFKK